VLVVTSLIMKDAQIVTALISFHLQHLSIPRSDAVHSLLKLSKLSFFSGYLLRIISISSALIHRLAYIEVPNTGLVHRLVGVFVSLVLLMLIA